MADARPIRLLYWTREEFPTFRVDVDVLFGQELIGRGHHIDMVMQADNPQVPVGKHEWHGRTVFVGKTAQGGAIARFAKHWHSFWHDLTSLLRFARRSRYDAIQFRDTFVVAALGILVARARGLKYFYWLSFPYPESDFYHADMGHTRFPMLARLRGLVSGWLLYRWILPRADHAFVQSERMKQDVMAKGIAASKLTPIPMGISGSDIDRMPVAQATRDSGPSVLGYLGTLNADRHVETLIDTLAILRSAGEDVRMVFVGDAIDPSDRLALERHATELNVREHLEITGNLPRHEALQRMLGVDIAFSPCPPIPIFLPASPTKLVESLALGKPVIANDLPDQRLVLKASRAGIVTPWGSRYFARAVQHLLRCGTERHRLMGQRGVAWVRANRTYEILANQVESTYRRLLFGPSELQEADKCAR